MGTHQVTCQLSGLAIGARELHEGVRVVLVARDGAAWRPVAPPISGDYDSYGSIEKPVLLPAEAAALRGFIELAARGELGLPAGHAFGTAVSVDNLRALLEEVRQGVILDAVRAEGQRSQLVTARGLPLGFVFVLEHIYDAALTTVRREVGDERIDELTDAPMSSLVEAALGPPLISPAVFDDAPDTRIALADFALFRSWFDAIRAWTPPTQFRQLEPREVLDQVRVARTELARWPALIKAIDRYERTARPSR